MTGGSSPIAGCRLKMAKWRSGRTWMLALASAVLLAACAGTPDTVMPEVRFVFPQNEAVLAPGTYTLVAVATDNRRIRHVVFWRGLEMLGFHYGGASDTFRCGLDCRADSNRTLILAVEANDDGLNDTLQSIRVHIR